jgi:hypothetical protein
MIKCHICDREASTEKLGVDDEAAGWAKFTPLRNPQQFAWFICPQCGGVLSKIFDFLKELRDVQP